MIINIIIKITIIIIVKSRTIKQLLINEFNNSDDKNKSGIGSSNNNNE